MADPRPLHSTAVSQHTYVSAGLLAALVGAAVFYGQQLQRLDTMEHRQQEFRAEFLTELRELRTEVRELRSSVVRQPSAGR